MVAFREKIEDVVIYTKEGYVYSPQNEQFHGMDEPILYGKDGIRVSTNSTTTVFIPYCNISRIVYTFSMKKLEEIKQ